MSIEAPEKFFSGFDLELANHIDRNDVSAIRLTVAKVSLNKVHRNGMTFLFYAILSKRYVAITELVKSGANPKQVDQELGSPLDYAVRAPDLQPLKAILDAGVSPDTRNSWGTPLLFSAASRESQEMLRFLVEYKADLNATDQGLGRTAVFEAFSKQLYDHVNYLIDRGARVDIPLINGVTLPYSLERRMAGERIGSEAYLKLVHIKALMEKRGIKFPADSPPSVRALLKSKGIKVAE